MVKAQETSFVGTEYIIYFADNQIRDEEYLCRSVNGNFLTSSYMVNSNDSFTLKLYTGNINKINNIFLPDIVGQNGTGKNSEIFNDYQYNIASGEYAHAEGTYSTASGNRSHAEGSSEASGEYAHAEGYAHATG